MNEWIACAVMHTCVDFTVVGDSLYITSRPAMKKLKVKMSYLSVLLLLCLWFDRCESLTDSSLPAIFYPFGTDQGDNVVTIGDNNCDGPIDIPYKIFNHASLYVSYTKQFCF